MLRISSGENKRERAVAGPPPELRETRTLPAKLICVAPTELLEATRIVSEPRPQLGARRQLGFPCVQPCSLPRHPSRPEAIDQDSVPVRTVRWLVHALQSDIHRMTTLRPVDRLQVPRLEDASRLVVAPYRARRVRDQADRDTISSSTAPLPRRARRRLGQHHRHVYDGSGSADGGSRVPAARRLPEPRRLTAALGPANGLDTGRAGDQR
jgi:hypothetical protein